MKIILLALISIILAQDTNLADGNNNADRLVNFQYYFVYQGQYASVVSTTCPAVAAEETPRLIDLNGSQYVYAWVMNCSSTSQCQKNVTLSSSFPGNSICCCSHSALLMTFAVIVSILLLLL